MTTSGSPLFPHTRASRRSCRTARSVATRNYDDAGLHSVAKRWSAAVSLFGTIFFLAVFLVALPVLLVVAFFLTLFEFVRWALGSDPIVVGEEGRDDDIVLVMPGTCAYVFWQLGMVQYIAENFDTSNVRLAGVSSGAIASCLLLHLEAAAAKGAEVTACERVRHCAQELFAKVEELCLPVLTWPMGFLARLGGILETLAADVTPTDLASANRRLRIGARRLSWFPLPALVPQVISQFNDTSDIANAVLASSTVWLIVKAMPVTFVRQLGIYCSDGVNPFSFFCFFEYAVQACKGLTARAAPKQTWTGLGFIYAVWNCGVMREMLPRRGRHIWVTPTVGGHLDIRYALRLSSWFLAEQWESGYRHAAELDAEGYWAPLSRRQRESPLESTAKGG
eukprot:TRINITY_DN36279_c0_g2_i1.p1 TRINITY_DN36279_c0_g2~~TRINITY_DN36279_c0_g2_i1.p1  ORF type:complete len:394 (-),score=49.47 TRINITY_DN36279_c0_g2_i1:122-1303(-)